jgi:hypothetical protein
LIYQDFVVNCPEQDFRSLAMVSSESIGRAGEFLAASVLEARGIRVSHVAMHGTDLWVETPTGRMLRVQVKTASRPSKLERHRLKQYYRFMFREPSRTIPAPHLHFVVALDIQLMLVVDGAGKNRRFAVEDFTEEAQEASILKHLY